LAAGFRAVGFLVVAFAFGDRFAVVFVFVLVAGFAFAVELFFFGDCFAVFLLVVDFLAAFVVAVRFLGERVAVVFVPVFFVAGFFFVTAFFVAILVAPVMSGVEFHDSPLPGTRQRATP
jgi:hypothetical protein